MYDFEPPMWDVSDEVLERVENWSLKGKPFFEWPVQEFAREGELLGRLELELPVLLENSYSTFELYHHPCSPTDNGESSNQDGASFGGGGGAVGTGHPMASIRNRVARYAVLQRPRHSKERSRRSRSTTVHQR